MLGTGSGSESTGFDSGLGANTTFDNFPPLEEPGYFESLPSSGQEGFDSCHYHSFGILEPHFAPNEGKANEVRSICMKCSTCYYTIHPGEFCKRCQSPKVPSYEWTHGLSQAAATAQLKSTQKSVVGVTHYSGGSCYGVPFDSLSSSSYGSSSGGGGFYSAGASSGGPQNYVEDQAAEMVASQGPYVPSKVTTSSLRDEVPPPHATYRR